MEVSEDSEIVKFHKRKRRKRKIVLITIASIFLIMAIVSFFIYLTMNLKTSIKYNETSNIDYNIELIPNEFYKTDRLGENVDVIASIIDKINVIFKYNINFEQEIEYIYSYKILAQLELKEKGKTNLIYGSEQVPINKQQLEGNSKRLEVSEEIKLDYNEYNNQINRLITQYKLDNTESQLILTMQINVVNKETKEKINTEATNVMSVTVPLNTKTVEVTTAERVKDNIGEIIIAKERIEASQKFLYLGIGMLVLGVGTIVLFLRYNAKTRSAEKMYELELKKILFDYKSYVQKISKPLDTKSYQLVKIESFTELLQMREELQSPILMYTEKNELKTIFMMIKDNMLFVFVLSSKNIRKNLIEKSQQAKAKNEARKETEKETKTNKNERANENPKE